MKVCKCGCGEDTKGGNFKSGHDQKLRSNIEEDVGGLLQLRDLVEIVKEYCAEQITLDELGKRIKKHPVCN